MHFAEPENDEVKKFQQKIENLTQKLTEKEAMEVRFMQKTRIGVISFYVFDIIFSFIGFVGVVAALMCAVIFNTQKFNPLKVFGILLGFLCVSALIRCLLYGCIFYKHSFVSESVQSEISKSLTIGYKGEIFLKHKKSLFKHVSYLFVCFAGIVIPFILSQQKLIEIDVCNNIAIGIAIFAAILTLFVWYDVVKFYDSYNDLKNEEQNQSICDSIDSQDDFEGKNEQGCKSSVSGDIGYESLNFTLGYS